MATEDKSSQFADLKKLNRPRKHWLGVRGYDIITEEYDHDGKLSKVTREHQRGKTLWDWLQLLIIPFIIGAGAIWFNAQQSDQSLKASQMQHTSDQKIAQDQDQATILQTYMDDMQDLLLNHQLWSKYDFETTELAEARTEAALTKLDPKRKGIVVQFLYTSGLIGYLGTDNKRYPAMLPTFFRVNLTNADLTGAYLKDADFHDVNLTSVILTNADLTGANLSWATLTNATLTNATLTGADLLFTKVSGTIFDNAHLSGAYLSSSDLSSSDLRAAVKSAYLSGGDIHLYPDGLTGKNLTNADLTGADLSDATLTNANLSGATLSGATLTNATLTNANLSGANLGCYELNGNNSCADLTGTDLRGAILTNANLDQATITQQQLDQVSSCKGAILPKGLTCHRTP